MSGSNSSRIGSGTDASSRTSLAKGGQASLQPIPISGGNVAATNSTRAKARSGGGGGGFEVGVGDINKQHVHASGLSLEVPSVASSEPELVRRTQSTGGKFTPITPLRSPAVMPTYTQVSSSPSVAAGVPVLELIRKFEEEKILNRDDRLVLNEALYNPERRDLVVKALQAIELSSNSKFAIRRLKALIHQNGTGEVSSKVINQQKADGVNRMDYVGGREGEARVGGIPEEGRDRERDRDSSKAMEIESPSGRMPSKDERSNSSKKSPSQRGGVAQVALLNTQSAIEQVISNTPMYVNPENFNVCSKIARRLRDFLMKYKPSAMGVRKFAVLIGSGSFNPLTRMHLRSYFVAKQYLEQKCGFVVLGSLLSPAHGMTVRERYRTNQKEIMPSPHRLAIAQLLVKDSKWLSIDPWEITRRRPMDYLSLLEHTHKMLGEHFPQIDFKVLYLAKANAVPKIAPAHLKAIQGEVGVVSVCRALEYDAIQTSLSAKWNGLFWCVEDTAVLDATMDIVTSRKVREKIRAGGNIAPLVGDAIDLYARTHKLGPKMSGAEEWGDEEKLLPVAASRPQPILMPRFNSSTSGSISSARERMGTNTSSSTAELEMRPRDSESIVIDDEGVRINDSPLGRIQESDDADDDNSVGGSITGGYADINAAGGAIDAISRGNIDEAVPYSNNAGAYEPSWSPRAEVSNNSNRVYYFGGSPL